jgi:hypothetical protein
MTETIIGSFIIFVLAGALLSVGQWFGRPPVTGKCSPDDKHCCLRRQIAGKCPKRRMS